MKRKHKLKNQSKALGQNKFDYWKGARAAIPITQGIKKGRRSIPADLAYKMLGKLEPK
jgi:hypothetical protein